MKLILTRHGETIENIKKIIQGQSDGKLSKKGIEQAEKLGLRFKGKKIDAIYSSDLKRTVDTAQEIVKHHQNLNLILDKRSRERFLGEFQGKAFPDNWDWDNLPASLETDQKLFDRAKSFLEEIYLKHKDDTVIVASHNGIMMALLLVIHNQPYSDLLDWEGIKNTAVYEFEIEKNEKVKTNLVNCIRHLEKEKNIKNNYVFIDGQNLYQSIIKNNWKTNHIKFRKYLEDKYSAKQAYYFLGYESETQKILAKLLQKAGFIVIFKEHDEKMIGQKKGNVDSDIIFEITKKLLEREDFDKVLIVSGDGDYKKLVDYLIKKNKFEKILFPTFDSASSLYNKYGSEIHDCLEKDKIRNKIKL